LIVGIKELLKFKMLIMILVIAGAHYGEIKRSLETINIVCESSEKEAMQLMVKIEKKMDLYAQRSPEIPQAILKKYRPAPI
jgi:hypothetical protein